MKKNSRKRKFARKLIALGLILVGLLFLVDMRIRPIIEKTAMYQSKILASRMITKAVSDVLSGEHYDYASLVEVIYTDSQSVSSVKSNMVSINRLKNEVTAEIDSALLRMSEYDLGISLGTISGFHIFYEQGPVIPIKAVPEGFVQTSLISEFTDTGINQTLHRIILNITVDISAIIPGYTTSAELSSNFIVAETVIVGEIPEAYTHVITGEDDVLDKINDYGF